MTRGQRSSWCAMRREQLTIIVFYRAICRHGGWCTQQMRHWLPTGCSKLLVEEMRSLLPSGAVARASRLRSASNAAHCSGRQRVAWAGYEGTRQRKGSRFYVALAEKVHQVTGGNVEWAFIDQGDAAPSPAGTTQQHAFRLEVAKHSWPRGDWCSCQDVGLSNGASHGPLVCADSPGTTNVSPLS